MICPFCKEEILEGAVKCRHCGSMLTTSSSISDQKKGGKIEYSSYSQVPWYRKNWFFNLATLLFWPAAVYILLTGNVYFVKNGKVRPIGIINKIVVFLWAAIFTYLIITSVLGIGGGGSYVNVVKEGHFKDYPNIEIGKAFNNFFSNPKWKHFKSDEGKNVVEFNGEFLFAEKNSEAKIQYVVEDDSFEVAAFAINGEIQNDIVYASLMEKVFEASPNNETETNQDDMKNQLMTTMGDLKVLMAGIESYITDNGAVPAVGSIDELQGLLTPKYMTNVPIKDPWGSKIYYERGKEGHEDLYIISSFGPDKIKGTDDDIVYSNGVFSAEKYPDLANIEGDSSENKTEESNLSQATDKSTSLIEGTLKIYGEWAAINYYGEDSGDWVPYFFKVDSDIGRAILATFKDGETCKVNGTVLTMENPPQGIDVSGASEINEIMSIE